MEKNKKDFVFDKKFLVSISVFIFGVAVILTQWETFDKAKQIILIIVLLIDTVIIFIEPNYYITDKDGLSIYYFLFIKDYHKWEEIKSIRVYVKRHERKKDFFKYYIIRDTYEKQKPSYMKNIITRSESVKKLINKYRTDIIRDSLD